MFLLEGGVSQQKQGVSQFRKNASPYFVKSTSSAGTIARCVRQLQLPAQKTFQEEQMNRHIGIFLAGVMIVLPLAACAYILIAFDNLGRSLLTIEIPPGLGAVGLLAAIYLVGLAAKFWVFRIVLDLVEAIVSKLPGIRLIFESVRDLLQLFGGKDSMGKVVQYCAADSNTTFLGILTNEKPPYGQTDDASKVSVYLPFTYMFGGITVYCNRTEVTEIDMPVEQALKLCATAFVMKKDGKKNEGKR